MLRDTHGVFVCVPWVTFSSSSVLHLSWGYIPLHPHLSIPSVRYYVCMVVLPSLFILLTIKIGVSGFLFVLFLFLLKLFI